MNYGIFCEKAIEKNPLIFESNEIVSQCESVNLIESYFKKIPKYGGIYITALKAHSCSILRDRKFTTQKIGKLINLKHSTVLVHLKRNWTKYEKEFLEKEYVNCLHNNLYPETIIIPNSPPGYKLKSLK